MEQISFLKALRGIMLVLVIAGCTTKPEVVTPPPAVVTSGVSDDQLDAAIRETSDYLNKQLPKGNKLVILNIQSEFPALSEYIIDELIANTVNDKVFTVVDRQQLNAVRAELVFQMSGEVDDATAQALGRMAGAQIIISGAVSLIGDLYRLRVRALNVQSAQIEGQFNRNIPDGPMIAALVRSRATDYGGGTVPARETAVNGGMSEPSASVPMAPAVTSQPVPAPEQPKPVVPTTYKVGDRGPAGGIVFFDKGYYTDSWRYLEATSQDVGIGVPWAASMRIVSGTSTAIGTGKRNSDLIRGSLEESVAAALVVLHYSQGGYSDWYLPSKDELNLMYQNLKQNNLGSLNGWYWSSSDAASSIPDNDAWSLNFSNGNWNGTSNGDNKGDLDTSVRPIRQF